MMICTEKLDRAIKVLRMVKRSDHLEIEGDADVQTYRNGRENGLTIRMYIGGEVGFRYVTFAENRNSDHIVVYDGDVMREIDKGLDESPVYRNRKLFDSEAKAARYVVLLLKCNAREAARIARAEAKAEKIAAKAQKTVEAR